MGYGVQIFMVNMVEFMSHLLLYEQNKEQYTGPSCSKLTMSLVNDSLRF